ncbi:MAG: hypothetical protein ABL869_10390 [Candidatus Nitrotoga sp.]
MSNSKVDYVTKKFKLGQLTNLKHTALSTLNRLTGRPGEECKPFKTLNDTTFSVKQGEVPGIIDHNDASKSTLLKLKPLAHISSPAHGSASATPPPPLCQPAPSVIIVRRPKQQAFWPFSMATSIKSA